VQDVGLIFLSAMATSVVELGTRKGLEEKVILGSALVTLTLSTALVGLLIVLVGASGLRLLQVLNTSHNWNEYPVYGCQIGTACSILYSK
jgi:hypothetical protein